MNEIRCIYCLNHFDSTDITKEDFWPVSWHINKKQNTPKWIVPACYRCNQAFSKLDGKLLQYFGLTLNPKQGTFTHIAQKAVRAFKPSSARDDDKDKRCRQNNLNNLMNNIVPAAKIPKESVLPTFEPTTQYKGADGVLIARDDIIKFGEKLVRGVIYYFYKQYIEKTHCIETFIGGEEIEDQKAYDVNAAIEEMKGFSQHLDKYLNGLHTVSVYDLSSRSGVVALGIWEQLKMLAFIQPR